jgi:hypothetical protein
VKESPHRVQMCSCSLELDIFTHLRCLAFALPDAAGLRLVRSSAAQTLTHRTELCACALRTSAR